MYTFSRRADTIVRAFGLCFTERTERWQNIVTNSFFSAFLTAPGLVFVLR